MTRANQNTAKELSEISFRCFTYAYFFECCIVFGILRFIPSDIIKIRYIHQQNYVI